MYNFFFIYDMASVENVVELTNFWIFKKGKGGEVGYF